MSKETKLLIGCTLGAVIPFLLLLYFQMVWLGLFIALLSGVIFMARLVSMGKDKFESRRSYLITYGLVFLIILFQGISFAWDYSRKSFQKELLLEIRKTIEEGITKAEIGADLIHVLAVYQQEDRDSIIDTYKDLNPNRLLEENIYWSNYDIYNSEQPEEKQEPNGDNVNHFYELDEEKDEIRFIIVAEIPPGEDPEYQNYDGQTGKFEMMYVLNEEGVEYEVRN